MNDKVINTALMTVMMAALEEGLTKFDTTPAGGGETVTMFDMVVVLCLQQLAVRPVT
jgi:hypothetical protein